MAIALHLEWSARHAETHAEELEVAAQLVREAFGVRECAAGAGGDGARRGMGADTGGALLPGTLSDIFALGTRAMQQQQQPAIALTDGVASAAAAAAAAAAASRASDTTAPHLVERAPGAVHGSPAAAAPPVDARVEGNVHQLPLMSDNHPLPRENHPSPRTDDRMLRGDHHEEHPLPCDDAPPPCTDDDPLFRHFLHTLVRKGFFAGAPPGSAAYRERAASARRSFGARFGAKNREDAKTEGARFGAETEGARSGAKTEDAGTTNAKTANAKAANAKTAAAKAAAAGGVRRVSCVGETPSGGHAENVGGDGHRGGGGDGGGWRSPKWQSSSLRHSGVESLMGRWVG